MDREKPEGVGTTDSDFTGEEGSPFPGHVICVGFWPKSGKRYINVLYMDLSSMVSQAGCSANILFTCSQNLPQFMVGCWAQ